MSASSAPPAPSILIALPSGLVTSGVVAWAVRLVNAFANRGRLAGLILHAPSRHYAPLDIALHYNVRVHDLSDLPPLAEVNGDLSPFIPRYRDALHELALGSGHPVAFSPNLLGDCYSIAAAISMVEPEIIRTLGWAHVDLPYEVAVLKHFEPVVSRFVACSEALRERLAAAIPHRAKERSSHIAHIPYGVALPDAAAREPYQGQRPLRLIYSGRLEQDVKRVGALVHLSDELTARGVAHHLTLLGDGPAAADVDRACATRRSISRVPAVSTERVHAILREQDLFVMASRVEGLSVSLLESMACGCVPVITRTRSGAAEAITHGVNGRLVEWELTNAPDHQRLGVLLADAVCNVVSRGLAKFSAAARETVRDRFTLEAHVAHVLQLVDQVAAEEPRSWPASRPCAFTASAEGGAGAAGGTAGVAVGAGVGGQSSGTVPKDAAARFQATLTALKGRRVIIHGTGRHTQELRHALAPFAAAPNSTVIAFTDDDPTRHGETILGLPVIAPAEACAAGATDVVISSFINQDDIWQRRHVYESRGLTVHRLYPEAA